VNHLLRLTWLLLTAPFRKTVPSMFQTTQLHLRVWPTDLDIQMHMNNGVYLSLLDLGRIDLLLKSRAYLRLTRSGFYPVVASEAIRFRKSLQLFRPFTIHTWMCAWDEKFFYLRQDFRVGDEVYAAALIKGCFLKRGSGKGGGRVPVRDMFAVLELKPPMESGGKMTELLNSLEEELRD